MLVIPFRSYLQADICDCKLAKLCPSREVEVSRTELMLQFSLWLPAARHASVTREP